MRITSSTTTTPAATRMPMVRPLKRGPSAGFPPLAAPPAAGEAGGGAVASVERSERACVSAITGAAGGAVVAVEDAGSSLHDERPGGAAAVDEAMLDTA